RPRRRREGRSPKGSGVLPGMLLGAGVLLSLVVGIGVVVWAVRTRVSPFFGPGGGAQAQQPTPQQPPEVRPQPQPLPIDPGWTDNALRPASLSDLVEYAAVALYPIGKNGMHGYSSTGHFGDRIPIRFNDAAVPKGLSMHPPEQGYARVKYQLGG